MNRRFKFDRKVPHEEKSLKTFGENNIHSYFNRNSEYKTLIWNIFKSKKKRWKSDFDQIHRRFDLLLLQEAKIDFNHHTIEDYDPNYNWVFGESFILNKCGSSCGVLTGSKIKESHAFNIHDSTREPILQTPKSTAFTYYPIRNQTWELLVINTHFINFRTRKAFEVQLKQITEFIGNHSGPVLFAGDFNSWSGGRTKELFRAMENYGLKHAKMENERRSFLMLDHVFSRYLRIDRARLMPEINSSDHIPLNISFKIDF